MFYIFLISLIILLFPIPLKFKLVFNNNELKIFIYKKQVKTSNKFDLNKTLDKLKNKESKTQDTEHEIKNKQQKNKASAKAFFHICLNNFFKPTLKIDFNINFGFNDASATAMVYGFVNAIPGFIYNILCKFFKIKKFKFNVQPVFNNEIIYIEISSIIFVNLVKVIYISLKFDLLYFKEKKFMKKGKNKKARVKFGGGI
ncbi:DUF2953 domain-containing protein [Clostridium sp. KNHs214]|uniref:DUF2953 domain-containing protein n=1 Tax=Clostridium sp. KNHs214 TaxID=1540257 RepID=UPI000551FAD2|nr:DUF2953 domain-containing protein [Clostridium sp. KNHs214]